MNQKILIEQKNLGFEDIQTALDDFEKFFKVKLNVNKYILALYILKYFKEDMEI